MKRLLNLLVLFIFLNFLALPSIATALGLEVPITNIVLTEEENTLSHGSFFSEKTIPRTLNIHDFIKFFEPVKNPKKFTQTEEDFHLSPHLTIFSPPPEFFI